jgi:hypothetical protein
MAIALGPAARRAVRARLYLASRDGQGVTRTSVAPLRLVRRGR